MAVTDIIQSYLGKSADYFTIVGVLVTAFAAFRATSSFLSGVCTYFLSSFLGLSANFKNAGPWAVVTGCTDGIGKAYAEELARRGLNVVLISRTRSKLEDMAKDIESRFKVKTKVIAADFTQADIYADIGKELSGMDIGTLVNNVGMSYDFPQYFAEVENLEKVIINMINCNTASVAMMTALILPGMLAKKKGFIINIASASGKNFVPFLTLYAATKSFVINFTLSLQEEYGSSGVTFQVVTPYFVATKMSKIRKANVFVPSPESFVRSALGTVGMQGQTCGCWSHALQDKLSVIIPRFVGINLMKQARARGLKKKASKKE
ncbi:hypothetical protein C0Q70_05240 [Pomacea canaliculata]|uniref:Uncharacterized protein n=1 Tax=Pomacea canaliculata TaxID=400727 RepID=A0A2T7PKP0_POMCA|nr:very-long-chain 3-oxoacyl-CoA reductase-like [Pomacea canaliculata]PVD33978.1 hypothetical protein C0Q70_05240 [Pomacea canaliculata]